MGMSETCGVCGEEYAAFRMLENEAWGWGSVVADDPDTFCVSTRNGELRGIWFHHAPGGDGGD